MVLPIHHLILRSSWVVGRIHSRCIHSPPPKVKHDYDSGSTSTKSSNKLPMSHIIIIFVLPLLFLCSSSIIQFLIRILSVRVLLFMRIPMILLNTLIHPNSPAPAFPCLHPISPESLSLSAIAASGRRAVGTSFTTKDSPGYALRSRILRTFYIPRF